MKKSMKKLFTILLVLIFACKVFAAEGVVTFVKGKVEVKRGDSWVSLKVGDKVAQSEVINTGFQSEAKVKLMNNVLYLGPVTRVTLSTLSSADDRDRVNVYLSTGTIRSKVNRTDTKRVSYTVRTPIAVASVRGTEFTNYGIKKIGVDSGTVGITNTERLSKPKASKEKKNDSGEEKSKDDTSPSTETNANEAGNEESPEVNNADIEKIISDNIDKFADGDNIPGGEQKLSKGQQISMENTLNLGTGFTVVENKISEVTTKVSSVSEKEGTETETPTSNKPIIEEEVAAPSTGTLLITVTLPTEGI